MGTLTEVGSNFLLFFLVFGMSATVDIDKLRKQLTNKYALLTGISLQFFILPFVGFLVVKLFQFSAPVGITLLVVTSSPGGSYSNWWCSLFNAELALSVSMTALSTIVSVIMLPVNLIIYASGSYSSAVVKSLDWSALFATLFVVIGGISSGLFCSAYFKDSPEKSNKMHKAANRFGNISGMCLITYSILVSSSDNKAALWDQSWDFFVGLAIPAIIGITMATALSTRFDLEKPERVAVAVESCYQNTGIATSVAAVMFDTDKDDLATAISVPLYYGIVEMVLLATFCLICWKAGWTKAPADEKLCVVLGTSYEVEQGEAEAQAASIDAVLGEISLQGEESSDCEKAECDFRPKPPLVFEQTEQSEDELDGTGLVVLRKANTEETAIDSSDPLSSRESEEVGIGGHGSIRTEDTTSPPDSLSDEERLDPDHQMDGNGREAGGVGRLGKTISFVKARATGYRRAPVPNDDGSDRIQPSPAELPTGIPERGELVDGRYEDQVSPPGVLPSGAEQAPLECPLPQLRESSHEEADATPAEGKTID